MTHDELMALPHADILVAMHCALDDGGINEAGAAARRIHAVEDALCAAGHAWFATLLHAYRACAGALGGAA